MAALAEDSRRVLVVDDEQGIREMLVRFFETKGYGARAASGAEEALTLIDAERPHLVVLDLRLPGMDGIEALKRIKKLDERIAVVLLTAHASVSTAVDAMKLDAVDYITKPPKLTELLRVLASASGDFGADAAGFCTPGADAPLEEVMGRSPQIARVYKLVEQVAKTDLTVLIYGETGAGKSLVAGAIHSASCRAGRRAVRVDCGGIPDTLIESELFGHEQGAFTGAVRRNEGYFELADRGTLFLDEIANLSQAMMRKLLCALEDRQIYRVGGKQPIDVDIRVVAASNQNLEQLVQQGSFRGDLFHRLNQFTIHIPPLRERKEDIEFLTRRFVGLANIELHKSVKEPSAECLELLRAHDWPGNVRELLNVIKRAVLLSDGTIQPNDLRAAIDSPTQAAPTPVDTPALDRVLQGPWSLKDLTREYVRHLEQRIIGAVLEHTDGNKSQAARMLNCDYKTLYYKAKDLGY